MVDRDPSWLAAMDKAVDDETWSDEERPPARTTRGRGRVRFFEGRRRDEEEHDDDDDDDDEGPRDVLGHGAATHYPALNTLALMRDDFGGRWVDIPVLEHSSDVFRGVTSEIALCGRTLAKYGFHVRRLPRLFTGEHVNHVAHWPDARMLTLANPPIFVFAEEDYAGERGQRSAARAKAGAAALLKTRHGKGNNKYQTAAGPLVFEEDDVTVREEAAARAEVHRQVGEVKAKAQWGVYGLRRCHLHLMGIPTTRPDGTWGLQIRSQGDLTGLPPRRQKPRVTTCREFTFGKSSRRPPLADQTAIMPERPRVGMGSTVSFQRDTRPRFPAETTASPSSPPLDPVRSEMMIPATHGARDDNDEEALPQVKPRRATISYHLSKSDRFASSAAASASSSSATTRTPGGKPKRRAGGPDDFADELVAEYLATIRHARNRPL